MLSCTLAPGLVVGVCALFLAADLQGPVRPTAKQASHLINDGEPTLLYCEVDQPPRSERAEPRLRVAVWSDGVVALDIGRQPADYRVARIDLDEIERFLDDVAERGLNRFPSRGGEFMMPSSSFELVSFNVDGARLRHGWTNWGGDAHVPVEFRRRWYYTKLRARELVASALPEAAADDESMQRVERFDTGPVIRGR